MLSTLSLRHIVIGIAVLLGIALLFDIQSSSQGIRTVSDGAGGMEFPYYEDSDMMKRGEMAPPSEGLSARPSIAPPMPIGGTADIDDVLRDDRLIVRNAWMSAIVRNVQSAVQETREYAESVGGFVTSASVSGLESNPTAHVTLRVPVEQFDATLEYVRGSSVRVVSESVTGEDVTEQYVDTEARLRTLRASEEQFLEIMRRATRIEDVLNVQQQLERVRGQIESTEARLQHLERSARLSTVTVNYALEPRQLPITDPTQPWDPVATFMQALRDFRAVMIGIADGIIGISLYLAIAGIAYLGYRIYRRRQ